MGSASIDVVHLKPYRDVLSVPGVGALLAFGVIFRVPFIASSVVLTLHVVTTLGRGYGEAGVVATVFTVAGAIGQPWRGRAVDRHGLRRALVPGLVVTVLLWGLAPFVPYLGLLVVVFLGGLVPLPIFTVTRQSLAAMVDDERRRTAYSLDSMGVELSFMAGPALGVLIATHASTRAALLAIGAGTLISGLALFAFNPPTVAAPAAAPAAAPVAESVDGSPDGEGSADRIRWTAPLVTTIAAAVASVVVLAGTDVGIVAFARADDALSLTGLVFVTWGLGSMVGAAVYGGLHRPVPIPWLLLGLGLLTIPIGLVPSTPLLALAILPAAAMCAPVITATSDAVARLVPAARLGEAMGWHGSALTLGTSVGAPLAGVAMDAAGPWAGFALVGVVGTVLAGAGLAVQRLAPAASGRPAAAPAGVAT